MAAEAAVPCTEQQAAAGATTSSSSSSSSSRLVAGQRGTSGLSASSSQLDAVVLLDDPSSFEDKGDGTTPLLAAVLVGDGDGDEAAAAAAADDEDDEVVVVEDEGPLLLSAGRGLTRQQRISTAASSAVALALTFGVLEVSFPFAVAPAVLLWLHFPPRLPACLILLLTRRQAFILTAFAPWAADAWGAPAGSPLRAPALDFLAIKGLAAPITVLLLVLEVRSAAVGTFFSMHLLNLLASQRHEAAAVCCMHISPRLPNPPQPTPRFQPPRASSEASTMSPPPSTPPWSQMPSTSHLSPPSSSRRCTWASAAPPSRRRSRRRRRWRRCWCCCRARGGCRWRWRGWSGGGWGRCSGRPVSAAMDGRWVAPTGVLFLPR